MKILHYIDKKTGNQYSEAAIRFVGFLANPSVPSIDAKLVDGVSVWNFRKQLSDFQPDIVHIHGCWNVKLAMIERLCLSAGCAVVLTPHGQLSPAVMQVDFWKKRFLRILAYQFAAVRKCTVLHATTMKEVDELKDLGWRRRIALVRNPYVPTEGYAVAADADASSLQSTAETMSALYKKVVDTVTKDKLDAQERRAIEILLLIGNGIVNQHEEQIESVENNLNTLTDYNWNRIRLFALEHNILDIVDSAISSYVQGVDLSPVVVPSRFSVKPKVTVEELTEKQKKNLDEVISSASVDASYVAREVYLLHRLLDEKKRSPEDFSVLRSLIGLYETLRWGDVEEDELLKCLSELRLEKFFSRILSLISTMWDLPVGFMPLPSTYDRKAKKYHNLIFIL